MVVNSQTELGEALATQDFDRIVGTPESNWIDFKRQPYATQPQGSGNLSAHGRSELCKDVAAFANLGGGCIVVGYQTERNPLHGSDVASSYSCVQNALVNIDSYKSAIRNGVYPLIREPRIQWFNVTDTHEGILLIEVNPQSSEQKPFILRRLVEGDEIVEAISIPTRNGDMTDWHTAEKIHAEIRAGISASYVSTTASSETSSRNATETLNDVEGEKNWFSRPVFWLQAIPSGNPAPLLGFFGVEGLANKLQNFSPLRTNGFNLRVFGQPDYVDGNLVYGSRNDAYIRLDANGLFTLAILASPQVIGWGLQPPDDSSPQPVVVNGTVVIEETVEFCRFVQLALKPTIPDANWTYRLTCRQFMSDDIRLGTGNPRLITLLNRGSSYQSHSDSWVREVPSGSTVSVDALQVVTHFYALFAIGPESIPFTGQDGIDVESFLTMSD